MNLIIKLRLCAVCTIKINSTNINDRWISNNRKARHIFIFLLLTFKNLRYAHEYSKQNNINIDIVPMIGFEFRNTLYSSMSVSRSRSCVTDAKFVRVSRISCVVRYFWTILHRRIVFCCVFRQEVYIVLTIWVWFLFKVCYILLKI